MTQPESLAAFDAAAAEVGVRNVLLLDRLRGAFVRRITTNTEGHAMTKEAMRQALDALEAARGCISQDRQSLADCRMCPVTNRIDADGQAGVDEYDEVLAQADAAIAALRTALNAPQQPVAWPCEAVTADFEENTITLEMRGTDWHVSAGEYLLIPPAAPKD